MSADMSYKAKALLEAYAAPPPPPPPRRPAVRLMDGSWAIEYDGEYFESCKHCEKVEMTAGLLSLPRWRCPRAIVATEYSDDIKDLLCLDCVLEAAEMGSR